MPCRHRHPAGTKKGPEGPGYSCTSCSVGSGGRIRTCDLRVMSPTSCQTAPPRTGARMIVRQPRPGKPICPEIGRSVVDGDQQGIGVETGPYVLLRKQAAVERE